MDSYVDMTCHNVPGQLLLRRVTSENWHELNQGHWDVLREIVKYEKFPLWIHKFIFLKPKWFDNCDTMPRHIYTKHLHNFPQVLSSYHPLLAVQVSLCLLPLMWPGVTMSLLVLMLKVSGSLALWTWLSVPTLYLLLFVCLQVPVLLSGSTLIPNSCWLELWNSVLWVTN